MKKKGLIISTIVMVLVLVVSLSTATFAWFSAQAQATISNINMTTEAAKGLQIAVKTTDTATYGSGYVNGGITYTNSMFGGTADGWGYLADFAQLKESMGTMDHATTKLVGTQTDRYAVDAKHLSFTHEVFGKVALFDITTGGTAVWAGTGDLAAWNILFNTTDGTHKDAETFYAEKVEGAFLVPTKYDKTMKPLSYRPALANGTGVTNSADYLSLPIAVRATMDVQAILCEIKITKDITGITNSQYGPGMAAACYIEIEDNFGNVELVKAYPAVTAGSTSSIGTGKDDLSWSYFFVVAYGATTNLVTANVGYDLNYTIWIEGTDDMCFNATAGSGFGVDILYKYETDMKNSQLDAGNKLFKVTAGGNIGEYKIIDNLSVAIA